MRREILAVGQKQRLSFGIAHKTTAAALNYIPLAMPERVDARDVLDANARVKRAFSAQQVGYFRKAGPNPWDDYEFVRTQEEPFEPYPGTEIQLEKSGTQFRIRKDGRVVRVQWSPGENDPKTVRDDPAVRRRYFVDTYLEQYDDAPGLGAGAMIARKLT